MRTRKFSDLSKARRGFEQAVVYDMRTKERRWLNNATVLSANRSENEEFALGLRDAETHKPVELVAVAALFRRGETQARRIPKYLIKGSVLPNKNDDVREDIITTWLARMSVYGDPVRSKAYRQGYSRIHTRTALPIQFAQVGHPCFQTHFRT